MLVLLVLLFTCMQIRCSSRIPPSLGFPATASASPVAIRIASKTKVSMIKDLNWRMPLAGGLAGGLATFILYPIDAVKSLCQSNPTISLGSIINMLGKGSAYAGVLPVTHASSTLHFKYYTCVITTMQAALGAVPSSAVYFGTYEAFKRLFADTFHDYAKPLQHMCAAASGNLLSSSIFVPKDVLKHTVQAIQSGSVQINGFGPNNCNIFRLIRHLYNTKGLKAFYPSYRVTLLKNVPSAIVRFSGNVSVICVFFRVLFVYFFIAYCSVV